MKSVAVSIILAGSFTPARSFSGSPTRWHLAVDRWPAKRNLHWIRIFAFSIGEFNDGSPLQHIDQ